MTVMAEKNQQIMVSICCLTFNQEKYIERCLQGFLMQETTFNFEVLIHDDASTDKTTDIILQYKKRFPDIIKTIFQTENQYQTIGIPGIYKKFLYPNVQGKYIAYCEGDDFYFDRFKLQKQYEVMERHAQCHMCCHKVQTIKEDGSEHSATGYYPQKEIQSGVINSYDFLKGLTDGYFFHTSSFFCRANDIFNFIEKPPKFYCASDLDDVPLLLYFGSLGSNYYLNDCMTCYRRNSQGSWTETQKGNKDRIIQHKWKMIEVYDYYEQYTHSRYTDLTEHWKNNERFMIAEIQHDYTEMCKKKYCGFLKKRNGFFVFKVYIAGMIQILFPNFLKDRNTI